MMIDGIEGRMWADHGHVFSDLVARSLSSAWTALKRLNAIQFDAPWDQAPSRTPRRPGQA